MSRRKSLWISMTAIAAAAAIVLFWPKSDGYGYLRALHPNEFFGEHSVMGFGGPSSIQMHVFEFPVPAEEVRRSLRAHGARQEPPPRDAWFELPSGKEVYLSEESSRESTLDIWDDNPSWLQAKLQQVRDLLHLP